MQRSPHLLPLCLPTPPPPPAGMKAGSQALIFKHCKLKPQASPLQCESLQAKELPRAPLCRRLQHPRAAIGSSAELPALHQSWGGAHIIHRSFPKSLHPLLVYSHPRSWSTCCFGACQGPPALPLHPAPQGKPPDINSPMGHGPLQQGL